MGNGLMAMQLSKCTFCSGEAIYLRAYSGERYCKKCYIRTIEKHVQRTITKYKMLRPDDRVALALSGGKDSISLLQIMSSLEERFPQAKLVAITIDEGIAGYRSEAIRIARENCKKLGVEHHVYSFKKFYNHSLDEIVDAARRSGKLFICSYCGILRRKALNVAAREVQATKLATAHNLDDELQSIIMNFLRGDLYRLSSNVNELEKIKELVPRIKPLSEVSERDVAFYAFLKKARFQSFLCPYMESSLRSDVRKFLNILEEKHAGMKFITYKSFKKVQPLLKFPENRMLGLCQRCGEPTSGEVCLACKTLQDIGNIED
ncbi:MAG: TIGR00269 family protein [Candidatus Bathyarchaeota archaeon]